MGEFANSEWLYYLPDVAGYVRQGTDSQGQITSAWTFDPDGTVLIGPQGLVSHLVCGGVYDWSTGLIYKGGRYFDPTLGIWLALTPLIVVQSLRGRRRRRRGYTWYLVVLCIVAIGGTLVACGGSPTEPSPTPPPVTCTWTPPPPMGGEVYLTFDDGPGWSSYQVGNTNKTLDTLQEKGVQATFFILGGGLSNGNVSQKEWDASVQRIVGAGHSWGLHGWDHSFATGPRTAEHLIWELEQVRAAVSRALGNNAQSAIWRAPGGLYPGNASFPEDAEIGDAVANKGFGRHVGWNDIKVQDKDYMGSGNSDELRRRVVQGIKDFWTTNHYAPVVLLHCVNDETVAALPGIIDDLKKEGYHFLKL